MMKRVLPGAALAALMVCAAGAAGAAGEPEFTTDFNLKACRFLSSGRNPYFVLVPGHRLVLEGIEDDGEELELQITVLFSRKTITVPGLGSVVTRVVEEREWIDDELVEVSRNFFAICGQTNSVVYFGEEVDIYEDGEIVSHDGAWRAGVNGARPGIIMPGTFLLGSRYFQEIAPGVAMDRGENTAMGLTMTVPAGRFTNVVEIEETTPLERGSGKKYYALGVGLIKDGAAELEEVHDPAD